MKRLLGFFAATAVLVSVVNAGCGQPASVPTPTSLPAPTTKSPVTGTPLATKTEQQPTAVPSKKADFPQKGKAVTLLIPWNAGGSTDVGGRLLAPLLEKELGTPVQVVNKPGAGSQTGLTELALAKPDGYTLGFTNLPTTINIYLDPERKAAFNGKSFQPVAMHVVDPIVAGVAADSPYKSMKNLIEAAKASPEKIRISTTGILSVAHLGILQMEKVTGAKFATVHFDGGSAALTALMGGHVDVQFGTAAELLQQSRNGQVRVLGILDKEESRFYPGVKTMEAQGYKVYGASAHVSSMPAGTPKEVADILGNALKKAMTDATYVKKMEEMGLAARYSDAQEAAAYWTDSESQVKPLLELGKR